MTRQHNGFGDPTPFSRWLRGLPDPLDSSRVSNQNLDYVWHDYRRNYVLTIEEKTRGGDVSSAQGDTHHVIEQMLRASDGLPVQTLRGIRPARYFGHYVIRFENTTPDDGRMWINGVECGKPDLIELLSFATATTEAA